MAPFKFATSNNDTKDYKEQMRRDILESDYTEFLKKQPTRNCSLPFLEVVEIVEVDKLSETTARAVFRFPVLPEYLNPTMTLHGGHSAGLYDIATTWTLAPIRKPGSWTQFGTTRSLNITYLRPAMEGEMLRMECEIVHAGKKLCLIKAVLMREKDRAIISTCEHQKYNIDADAPKL